MQQARLLAANCGLSCFCSKELARVPDAHAGMADDLLCLHLPRLERPHIGKNHQGMQLLHVVRRYGRAHGAPMLRRFVPMIYSILMYLRASS